MLNADDVRCLDRLSLSPPAVSPAADFSGARVAKTRGFGLEFHDFRRYQPGDDPRAIDWTVHARLRQLVVRVYRSDARLQLSVLLDTSGSMSAGRPDKLTCAKRMVAALSYVAVQARDAVALAVFDETIRERLAPATGRLQLLRVLDVLNRASAGGKSSANRALTDYGSAARGPGLAVVISDFFHEQGAFEGLRRLLQHGWVPAAIQVVAREELDPAIDDEIELTDVEDPDRPPVVVDRRSAATYRERVARVSIELGEFCVTHGLAWTRVESSWALPDLLQACVDAGLLTVRR